MDAEIASRFGATLAAASRGALAAWRDADAAHATALVVVLDQFARHVLRADPDRDAKLAPTDALALDVADACVERGWWDAAPVPHQVFLLMPYRHAKAPRRAGGDGDGDDAARAADDAASEPNRPDLARLRAACALLERRREEYAGHGALLDKFYRTTLRRAQDAEGKRYLPGDDILERVEFEPDEETRARVVSHPVYVAVERFLDRKAEEAMKAMKAMDGEDEAALRASGSVARRFPFPSVAISLSGGVDSMVLATVLKRLSEEKSESKASPLFSVVATHVDYANRPESAAESAFVSDWCARRGVACVARRADEHLRRGATPREEYEAKSRAIRYDLYKEQMAIHGFPAVFVGHHEGDVQENVIANVMRGASALDLNGMRPEGVVEGVAIWRPMLGLPKEAIYDFAHAFGTPYFLDTTPRWSTRGKLRNQLVPLLSDVFGAGVMGNLKKLGDDAEELREMVESKVFAPFRRAIRSSDAGAYADLGAFEAEGRFFWREALRGFCHGIGVGAMTDKSVDQLRARVFPRAKRDGWITLKKGARSFVRGQTFAMFSLQFFGDDENDATEEREEASDESRRRAARRAEKRRGGGGGGGGGAGGGEGGGVSRNKTPLFRNPDGSPVEVRPGAAPGEWGATAVLGRWRVRMREVRNRRRGGEKGSDDDDSYDSSSSLLATSAPLDVFAVLRNEVRYYLPSFPRGGGGDESGRRFVVDAEAFRTPALRGVDAEVARRMPIVVPEGAGGDGGEYRVRAWGADALAAETCVEVELRFERCKAHSARGAGGE